MPTPLVMLQLILSCLIGTGTIFNYFGQRRQHALQVELKATLLELQLNLRREFNGRYVTLDRFNDLKSRVEHSG